MSAPKKKTKPAETATSDSTRTQQILTWAAEEERKRQAAGLPAPPLFPAPPTKAE